MSEHIFIHVLSLGEQQTNCYVIWSSKTLVGYVVDPADEGDVISQFLIEQNITLNGIVLTHGHFDHLLALLELELNFPVPVYLHEDDRFLLERAHTTATHFLGRTVDPVPTTTQPLVNGQILLLEPQSAAGASQSLGQLGLRVIHTPGHTPGSVCLLLEPQTAAIEINQTSIANPTVLLTGDTLFSYGIEPLTHRYSSPIQLSTSLDSLQQQLDGDTLILPGHGEPALLSTALKNRV